MKACYDLADTIEAICAQGGKVGLGEALTAAVPRVSPEDARLKIIHMFDQAIDEIALIPHLGHDEIEDLSRTVRDMQHKAFVALGRANVSEFINAIHGASSPRTLRFIGHTVASVQIPSPQPIDRSELSDSIRDWVKRVEASNLPGIPKAVILLKLRILLRFLADCDGATDHELRRRLKSLSDDLTVGLAQIDSQHKTFLLKIRESLCAPLKGTAFAIGLTADLITVVPLVGVAALTALPPPALSLPAPDQPDDDGAIAT